MSAKVERSNQRETRLILPAVVVVAVIGMVVLFIQTRGARWGVHEQARRKYLSDLAAVRVHQRGRQQ